ncbi:hypothetical protein MSBR3_2400 [Methanosarcina barkeri 3]|uniref:tRNA-guanine(15) transglycosylase-like domain-containing protein n=1 Tax=Methanosarcina barkeri 3 TaxID=1434107 RepID=A0A0E3SNS1_METBA|nr:hypothetical protein [Methanosarcina barkeri]AKB82978.1 hypothetical protein MSBR3_2400 [Methanosarcina barkeri 3]
MSAHPGLIKKMRDSLKDFEKIKWPLKNVLYTPVFSTKKTSEAIKDLKDNDGSKIMFDSGGFFVQQGKITTQELFSKLTDFYSQNEWGDYYVLPDSPPVNGDSDLIVEYKVRDTITNAKIFHDQLKENIQKKCIPVVQGHNKEQIFRCVREYSDLNVSRIGFGSFGTCGSNNGINFLTSKSMENVEYMMNLLKDYSLEVHAFGVGGTSSLSKLCEAGFTSFDSAGWKRAAAYGDVLFPFHSTHNITHRSSEKSCSILSRNNFEKVKTESNHACYFCEDFNKLQSQVYYRYLHNMIAIFDTVEFLKKYPISSHNDIP